MFRVQNLNYGGDIFNPTETYGIILRTECSLNGTKCSLNDTECSLNDNECSLNVTQCSLNDTECSLRLIKIRSGRNTSPSQ
jgi:hypothetical protein